MAGRQGVGGTVNREWLKKAQHHHAVREHEKQQRIEAWAELCGVRLPQSVVVDAEELMQLCPICSDDGTDCVWCDCSGLVPHDCGS